MFYYIYHADFVNKSLLLQRFFILFTNFACFFRANLLLFLYVLGKRFHKWRKKKTISFIFQNSLLYDSYVVRPFTSSGCIVQEEYASVFSIRLVKSCTLIIATISGLLSTVVSSGSQIAA